MKDKLTKEEVLHVAHLARINVSSEEIEKYQVELKQLLDEVEKIKDVDSYDDDLLISVVEHNTVLREDVNGSHLSEQEFMKNVPNSNGNFVEVPVMLNE